MTRSTLTAAVLCTVGTSGCGDLRAAFDTAVDATCDAGTVFLSGWWGSTNVASDGWDPIGGRVFLYWLDSDGNVCHGEPGLNGQPGSFLLPAWHAEAREAVDSGALVSDADLAVFQEAPLDRALYPASGAHLAQFGVELFRTRDTGVVFRSTQYLLGLAAAVSLDSSPLCLQPIIANPDNGGDCGRRSLIPSSPPAPGAPEQHPTMCGQRSVPYVNMDPVERNSYCVTELPQGSSFEEP